MASEAIEAVRRELESARHALRGAEESHAEAEREARIAQDRSMRAFTGLERNRTNVNRLEKALTLLGGEADGE